MDGTPWHIEWSGTLSMSNAEIDTSRRHLIELLNALNNEITSQKRDKAVIEDILGHMLDKAADIFSHEERLFFENTYPAAQEHAQIHSEVISKSKCALIEIRDNDIGRLWIEKALTIKHLLVDHLLIEDARYIEHMHSLLFKKGGGI